MYGKFLLYILFPALLFISCNDTPIDYHLRTREINKGSEKQVSGSADRFGLKLFKEVNNSEGDKNIFISPLSVSMALGMTLNGANGSTYEAMKSTLELNGLSEQQINEAYKTLMNYLTTADPKVALSIANSIWYRNTFGVEQSFIDVNKKYFKARIEGLDFNDPNSLNIINQWVNDNTKGLIEKILEEPISPATIMYLINAIYFKGTWTYQFDKNFTTEAPFYLSDGNSITCDMMNQKNKFNYFRNDLFQAVQLPYGDDSFNMTVLLPAGGKNVNDVIGQFSVENWLTWNNSFEIKEGNIWLPKFKLEYKLEMKDVLTELGMGIAFEGADFTRINKSGGLFISKVLHKTFVSVDEEGTEAAAVTAVQIDRTSAGSDEFYMNVNKPFVFVISEKESGNILFIGKIVNPD